MRKVIEAGSNISIIIILLNNVRALSYENDTSELKLLEERMNLEVDNKRRMHFEENYLR